MTSTMTSARPAIASIYDDKPPSYFANARNDIVEMLATGPTASAIELGCGAGGTGRAVLAAGKAGRYVGLELNEDAARVAAEVLTEVLVGDAQAMDLSAYHGQFDVLIISEVLEHLTDPWSMLQKLVLCLKPGGKVYASSPNIAYLGVVKNLIFGRFDYRGAGMMDRTHLRWFTPKTFKELFESAGVAVEVLRPMREPGWRGQIFNRLTANRFSHLFIAQMLIVGRRQA